MAFQKSKRLQSLNRQMAELEIELHSRMSEEERSAAVERREKRSQAAIKAARTRFAKRYGMV